jgi:hypothetical protein
MAVLVLLMSFVSASKERLAEKFHSLRQDIAYCWQYVLNMSGCVCASMPYEFEIKILD